MDAPSAPPTPYPEVNQLLRILHNGIGAILGKQLVGLYLEGSLARGGFDEASDIDFVAVTDGAVAPHSFDALQQMHARMAQLDARLAREIEGYYLTRSALNGGAPRQRFPRLERGERERLKWVNLGEDWIIHRHLLREYGVALSGPPPRELVEPLPAEALQRAMGELLREWYAYLYSDPTLLGRPGYQSYVVLTLCRILYTRARGDVVPKRVAADWARATLGAPWAPLIERAWRVCGGAASGQDPAAEATATLAFIAYACELDQR